MRNALVGDIDLVKQVPKKRRDPRHIKELPSAILALQKAYRHA
jgi:hypothetical protein